MSAGRGRVLLIMLVAVVALAVGETFLSKGMKQAGRSGGGWTDQAVAVVRNGWILADSLSCSSMSDFTCWPCEEPT